MGPHSPTGTAELGYFMNVLQDGRDIRDIKDTRIFAHAAAETQAVRESISRGGRRPHTSQNASRPCSKQPSNTNDIGFLEVFPRVASRPPKLLQELEALLLDRLRNNGKAASPGILTARDKNSRLAANLSLDAHRQVLVAFVEGFGSYAPLLDSIQAAFDDALDDGVRCAQDNVALRQQLAEQQRLRNEAAAAIRGEVMAPEGQVRNAAVASLQALQERAAKAGRRLAGAERDLSAGRAEEARLQQLVARLADQNALLESRIASEKAWSATPTAALLTKFRIGPLSKQDEAYLETEVGSTSLMSAASRAQPATALSASSTAVSSTDEQVTAAAESAYPVCAEEVSGALSYRSNATDAVHRDAGSDTGGDVTS